jgi:ATP-dependent helicase/DNAse subunit B
LFFAGLSEKAFPPPEREDRMYGEADYQLLARFDLPFVLRAERSQEEMLLFYEVLTRATRRLYLSYPGLDDKAQELLPSPYLAEVERILNNTAKSEMPDLSPLPPGEVPYGPREWRLMAVAQSLAGQPALLAGLCQDQQTQLLASNLTASLQTVRERSRQEGFGPWEGIIPGEAAKALLAARFGPEHRWSPSDLERYGYCPFQFLATKVARLEPLPELELETDFMARGSRLHATLARLHRKIIELESTNGSPGATDAGDYQRLMEDSLTEVFSRAWQSPVDRAMAEIDRRLVVRWLANYRVQHAAYEAAAQAFKLLPEPAHFEVSFGLQPKSDDRLSTIEPLKLKADGEQVLIAGRIDRVDLGRHGQQTWFTVLDYKTGRGTGYTKHAVRSGDVLQLPLYALAVQDLLLASQHAVPWHAGYWLVSEQGYRQMLDLYEPADGPWQQSEAWRDLRPRLLERVAELVRGIRRGDFPVTCQDENCTSRCDFHTVCRIHQVRALEKQWPRQP